MLTADDVQQARLPLTKLTEGYDKDEVDDLLAKVVATLRAVESGTAIDDPVTADGVLQARFQATKFREGYAQDAVDDLLDRVMTTLRERPAVPVPPPAPAAQVAGAPDGAVPGLLAPRRSWWQRVLGG
ncbi:DivIVA domain-containing protein [Cellulomonas sp. zg-ZUI222]|uniref:DivIVA domain-containing protein n=1 Tax=Cellulomonas wangleii TaxID=2816956 RepID=UPI001A94ADF3|nr:DivIVA domain-containing protein [Cellulomonas wangleii]MBO0922517.1 DivIVA domain-containing protein [Cellulomonas wangleii]